MTAALDIAIARARDVGQAVELARQRLELGGGPDRAADAVREPIAALHAAVKGARADHNGDQAAARLLRIVALDEFVAVEEASAEPLLGDADDIAIAAGSDLNVYGDGGVGKTTLELDAVIHLAAGVEWLGLRVPRPLRILVIENEGPRGLFRRKLDRRARSWDGPPFRHNVDVLEEPWGAFSFANVAHRAELAQFLATRQTDIAMSGPMSRLGTIGGGTPVEVAAFEEHLSDLRSLIGRPVALWLVHHESKSGEISGAWERAFDTILHLKPDGRNRSRLRWQKARWAPTLHGRTWTLAWLDGQTYDVVDRGDTPAADARAAADTDALNWITAYVAQQHTATQTGIARGQIETGYTEAHPGKGSRARARRVLDAQILLAAHHRAGNPNGEEKPRLAVTTGERANGIYLIPFSHAPSPLAETAYGEGGEDGSAAPLGDAPRQLAAAYREGGERRASGEGPEDEGLEWR